MTAPPWAAEVKDIVDPGLWEPLPHGQWKVDECGDAPGWYGNQCRMAIEHGCFDAAMDCDAGVSATMRALLRALNAVNEG